MHPLKQIEMVKLLNRLNNKGIRLLVSTHSDTMATKINNLLLLSQQDFTSGKMKDTLEKMGIYPEKGDLIDPSKIHVYQFVNDTDGKSIVEELNLKKYHVLDMILVCLTIAQLSFILKKQRLQWGWIMKRIKGHYIKEERI